MANQNGIITAPVNIASDIYHVLGLPARVITGTNLICYPLNYAASNKHGQNGQDGKINKWSKCKPVRGVSPKETTFTISAGNRGYTTDFPIFWGMKYPMNTAGQNYNHKASGFLLQLCLDVIKRSGGSHPNYEYCPPEGGTDFFRLTDFNGYNHNSRCNLVAGVAGAKPGTGTNFATASINRLDVPSLTIYASLSGSRDWYFEDISPIPANYYLVAEIYKTNPDGIANHDTSSTTPVAVYSASQSLATQNQGIGFSIPLTDILTALGIASSSQSTHMFWVCVGFNQVKSNGVQETKDGYKILKPGDYAEGSSAFIAPYSSSEQMCLTTVSVYAASPYVMDIQQYALPTSKTNFINFPQVETSLNADSLFFKGTIKNTGSNAVYLDSPPAKHGAQSILMRVKAVGNYDPYDGGGANIGYLAADSTTNSIYQYLHFSKTAGGAIETSWQIQPSQTATTFYAGTDAKAFIPYGITNYIIFEVSNDNGVTWTVTAMKSCYFKRVW